MISCTTGGDLEYKFSQEFDEMGELYSNSCFGENF